MSHSMRADTNVKLQAESHSAEIPNDASLAVREYPACRWLLNYSCCPCSVWG